MKILIVYLKKDEKLKKCLDSLNKYSPNVEIILRQANPKITEISEEVYQKVLDEVNDDIMIWHPDMVATKGWYEDLIRFYDSFDVLGCKIVYPNGILNHYGGEISFDGVGRHPHQGYLDIGHNEPLSCAFVTGPGMVIKQKVWKELKGFDFQFKYYIDTDFCFRAREKGFTVGVIPVKLIHEEGMDSVKQRPMQKTIEYWKKYHALFNAKWMHELAKYKI